MRVYKGFTQGELGNQSWNIVICDDSNEVILTHWFDSNGQRNDVFEKLDAEIQKMIVEIEDLEEQLEIKGNSDTKGSNE